MHGGSSGLSRSSTDCQLRRESACFGSGRTQVILDSRRQARPRMGRRPFSLNHRKPLTSPDDQSLLTRKIGGAREKAIDNILQTKPYKGGNQALWRLHALNIRDEHRLLLTAAFAIYANLDLERLFPKSPIKTAVCLLERAVISSQLKLRSVNLATSVG